MTPHLLQKIIEAKKREVSSLPESFAAHFGERRDFIAALIRPDGFDPFDRLRAGTLTTSRRSIIAEIKPKSPSEGTIFPRSSVPSIGKAYNENADAISVLCDTEFFGGGYDLLQEVRSLTNRPILAKEFMIDAKQIRSAASHGADAVLLIASILTKDQLAEFMQLAADLDLSVLLEVHSGKDVKKVSDVFIDLPTDTQQKILVGINNRDLDTLSVDLTVTQRLAPLIRELMPSLRCIIAESGIRSHTDVARLSKYVQGFLVGSSILRSDNPTNFLASLFSPRPKVCLPVGMACPAEPQMRSRVKFCGMTNEEDIVAAENLHVDFVGFIFVPSSPRHVTLAEAIRLTKKVKHAKTVGVFADMLLQDMQRHIDVLHLDYVQLYGNPEMDLCRQLNVPVIQAFRGVPSSEVLEIFLKICPYVLIDKEEGKDTVDLRAISALPAGIRSRLFLAGGLTPTNVLSAIKDVHPYAVDSARGIESEPGKKDGARMQSFLAQLSACFDPTQHP